MKYLLRYNESIKDYLLELTDIGFIVFKESDDKLALKREIFYKNNFNDKISDIGVKYQDISHYLTIRTCYEGRWSIKLYNLNIDGSYDSYYLNNSLIKEHYILPDFILEILNISIDTAIKVMYSKKIKSIYSLELRSLPYTIRVDEIVIFTFKN